MPDVTAAAITGALPLVNSGSLGEVTVATAGTAVGLPVRASLQSVSREYFTTVGLDVIAGGTFPSDAAAADVPPYAIVNRVMAAHMWPHASAVGQRLRVDGGEWRTVIGVVSDARQRLDEAPTDEVFLPLNQYPPVQARLVVRTSAPPERMAESLRDAVRRAEPQQPIDNMLTLEDARNESVAPIRVMALLITAFAIIGVTISLMGVAGVVGASVQARTSELGLQMALGATRVRVVSRVITDGCRMALTGIAVGLVMAGVMARSLKSLLYQVSPYDPVVHGAVMILLVGATIVGLRGPGPPCRAGGPVCRLESGLGGHDGCPDFSA